MKLADFFRLTRRSDLERGLAEAEAQIGWQKKRTERIQQRYDLLERKCVALSNEVNGLRSKLCVVEQQAEAFKEAAKALCTYAETAEELKRIYQAVAPCLDYGGFHLFYTAQAITGFSLSREYPYEDACGSFIRKHWIAWV